MIYQGRTVKGELNDLGAPSSVRIHKEEDTPADDLVVSFPFNQVIEELDQISVLLEDQMVFDGIVDEQKVVYGASGAEIFLSARSRAAYLLDNEALPQVYFKPCLKTIFERHISGYGFSKFIGEQKTFSGEFTVKKGMSEWDVLESFCLLFLNTAPRITKDNVVDATGKALMKETAILQNSTEGIPYSEISMLNKHYSLISEVFVRAQKQGNYSVRVCDEESIKKGIRRKRYLDAVDDPRTPVSVGEKVIESGKKDCYSVTAVCPGAFDFEIGQRVLVRGAEGIEEGPYVISKIKYTLDQAGEKSEITMHREEP